MAAEIGVVVLVPGDDDEELGVEVEALGRWVGVPVVAQAAAPTTSDAVTMTDPRRRRAARPTPLPGYSTRAMARVCSFGGAMRARSERS